MKSLIIKAFPLYQVIFYIHEQKQTVYVDAVFLAIQDPVKKPNL